MSLETRTCSECKKEFQRQSWDILKYERKGKIVCCSHSCSAKISNRNRNSKRLLVCLNCGQEEFVNETDDRRLYCSRKCYFEHQSEELAERARQLGKDKASKISETKAKKWAAGEYEHIKHSFAKGKYFFQKAGKEVWYRSSWELAFMKYLDSKDDVISCDYECVQIPYYDTSNNKRHYIPDFFVEYQDRKELIEVKPHVRKKSESNKRKFEAAREYCKQNNIKFKVISERYLKHVGAI